MTDEIRVEIAQRPDADVVGDRVVTAIQGAMEAHADLMRGFAEGTVRVKTGDLRGSIQGHTDKFADKTVVVLSANARSKGKDGSGEMYGPFLEYGTGEHGAGAGGQTYNGHTNPDVTYHTGWPGTYPHPFLRPALYDTLPTLRTNLDHAIQRALR